MARVVQRRSNPPYLLIVFVFLFLVSAIVAVMMYLDKTKADKQIVSLQGDKTTQTTEIARLTGQTGKLADIVVGQKSAEVAIKADTDMRSELNLSLPSLVSAVKDYVQKYNDVTNQLKGKSDELTQAKADLAKSSENIKAAQDKYDENAKKLEAANAQLLADVAKLQQEQKATIDNIKNISKTEADALNNQLAVLTGEIAKKKLEAAKLDEALEILRNEVGQSRPKIDPENMAAVSKGKISQVAVDGKTAYLNKGSRDGMSPGLAFAVFTPGAKSPKADVQVTVVRDNICEANITQSKANDPVMSGDDVVNPAFNPGRTYSFVVRGLFDIEGKGRATAQGADLVREVIRKAGGKVLDNVTVTTDFVVLGDQPELPAKPDEDASAQEKAVYEQIAKSVDDYNRVRDEALKWRIQPLNSNRFVALMGFGLEKP